MEVLEKEKLIVRGLYKNFDGKDVLKAVSFTVHEEGFLSVLGPNGCSKTTLLWILIGLKQQTKGQVLTDGEDISHFKSSKRNMGIVFQNCTLFPNMIVLENVEHALKLRPGKRAGSQKIALQTPDVIGMSDQTEKRPPQLLGGQQQCVAIARTLALNPKIILLDEPISALDMSMREVMKKEPRDVRRRFHSITIFITHEQEEAFYLSDRTMVMSEGNIEQIDTPQTIHHHPANRHIQSFVNVHLDGKLESLCKCIEKQVYEQ